MLRFAAIAAAAAAGWLALSVIAEAQVPSSTGSVSALELNVALEGHDGALRGGETSGLIVELSGEVAPRGSWRIDSLEIVSGGCRVEADACADGDVQGTSELSSKTDATADFDRDSSWVELPQPLSWAHNNRRRLSPGDAVEGEDATVQIRCFDREQGGGHGQVGAGASALVSCAYMIVPRTGTPRFPEILVPPGTPAGTLDVYAEMELPEGEWAAMEVRASNGGVPSTFHVGGRNRYFSRFGIAITDTVAVLDVDLTWEDSASAEAVVPPRGSVVARLGATDGDGLSAPIWALTSVVLNTTVGSIDPVAGQGLPGDVCAGPSSCAIGATELRTAGRSAVQRVLNEFAAANHAPTRTLIEADQAVGVPRDLRFRLACPGPGTFGDLRATVVAGDAVFEPPELRPLRMICGGDAARIVLSPAAADRRHSIFFRRTDGDDLDVLRIGIMGEDVSGRNSGLPTETALDVRDPEGGNARGIEAEIACADADRTDCDAVLRVAGEDALATGDYSLSVRAPRLARLSVPFHVSSAPAAIAVSNDLEGRELRIGERVTITAVVTDADDFPVADGTPVIMQEITQGSPQSSLQRALVDAATKGGEARAVYIAVAPGSHVITVSAGSVTAVNAVRSSALIIGRGCTVEDLTRTGAGPSFWLGPSGECSASDLIGQLEDAPAILLQVLDRWVGYAELESGGAVPGARDFTLNYGDALWILG